MVASGMKEAGYEYIVIDDCWQIGRDSLGFVVADLEKFPSGMKALPDYVHAKGLKFGIYSCAGRKTNSESFTTIDHARQWPKKIVELLQKAEANATGIKQLAHNRIVIFMKYHPSFPLFFLLYLVFANYHQVQTALSSAGHHPKSQICAGFGLWPLRLCL